MFYCGFVKAYCFHCGATVAEVYDGGWQTRSSITAAVVAAIRDNGGVVTRSLRCYCSTCASTPNILRGRKKKTV